MDQTFVRAMVDLRDRTLQKSRIAFGNRIAAVENGKDTMDDLTRKLIEKWSDQFAILEKDCEKDLKAYLKDERIIQRMCKVKGLSYILAGKLSSMIDIRRADTISALWRYAGMSVVDGHAEKLVKGEKAHFNRRLKTTCYLVASSFLKCKSPYRQIYDSARQKYENYVHTVACPICKKEIGEPWRDGHKHAAALRKMIKIFLAHLWMVWREQEGLPIREPYVQEQLGHTHISSPEEFGW